MASEAMFKNVPGMEIKVESCSDRDILANLYFLLHGEPAKGNAYKRKILSFQGFKHEESSNEFQEYKKKIGKSLSIMNLQQLCDFFEEKYSDSASANELGEILLTFVRQSMTANVCQGNFETKSTISSAETRRTSNSRKSNFKQYHENLFDTQKEIEKLQDELFSKEEEVVVLENSISLMRNANAPTQDLQNKLCELQTKQKLLKIAENRLKSKENSLKKQEEIFDKVQMLSNAESDDCFSEDEIVPNEDPKNTVNMEEIEKWKEQVNRQCFSENHSTSENELKNLSKSINNMLARQTVGSQLCSFDGSSCLKWPIFFSQYQLSNEACCFSPRENVLRLNNSLTGEARKSVEMLLIAAREPSEILDILKKKYGRPELIMDELLTKAHDLPAVESMESFLNFSTTVRNITGVLQDDFTDFIDQRNLLASFVNKLPPHLLTQWGSFLVEKKIVHHQETLKDFSMWVQQMSEVVSRITFVSGKSIEEKLPFKKYSPGKESLPRFHNENSESTSKICKICKKGVHTVDKCNQFQNSDVQQRWKLAQKINACFCCLRIHPGKCQKKKACNINNCERNHHPLLHKNNQTNTFARNPESTACIDVNLSCTLLKILPVKIKGSNGTFTIRALLDEGSTATLIDSSIANKIGLSGPVTPLCCKWTGEIHRYDENSQLVQTKIASKNSFTFYDLKNVRTIENLDLPEQVFDVEQVLTKFPFIKKVPIDLYNQEKPTILIGQNNASLIISRQVIQPHPNDPILSKTRIGWTVHGSMGESCNSNEIAVVCCEEADNKLEELVKSFFKMENHGVSYESNTSLSKEDEQALKTVSSSIRFSAGQYEVRLPWKDDNVKLPESRKMAMQRLYCLERRLQKDVGLAKAYSIEMEKLFEKKYAVPVSSQDLENAERIWYLPHFPVRNPNKPEKVRIVFDAAAKTQGFSLNNYLLTGPDMLAPMLGILLKFRLRRIAFAGDIKEMFNRVKIAERDTFSQCFLWRNMECAKPPRTFKMTAMTFGLTSSPFIAQYVKNHNAERYRVIGERAADAIIHRHYVDDYLDSVDDEEQAVCLINQVIDIHRKGGFEIRNFISNSLKVLEAIPRSLVSTSQVNTAVVEKSSQERILGMVWKPSQDCFSFEVKFHKVPRDIIEGTKIPTKRQVLKTVMSIYDPLGFLSPITIKAKILLQTMWRTGLGWDDEITSTMFKKWLIWLQELKGVAHLAIPRCYSEKFSQAKTIKMHIFSDASEHVYACAIYLRFVYTEGIQVKLVVSKARVAPLKVLTIPKLELSAALLGVRLSQEVSKHLEFNIENKYFWSDSKTVIHWIRSEKKLQTYMAVRVGEMLEKTYVKQWKWVPSSDNVADDCTRDTPNVNFNIESRWFNGPQFLYSNESEWAETSVNDNSHEENTDYIMNEVISEKHCLSEVVPRILNHVSWLKLLRITARVHIFLSILRKTRKVGSTPVAGDLELSKKLWCKVVQCQCFPTDLKNHQKSKSNRDGHLHNLSVFLDSDGLLRIDSRIARMESIPILEKEPIILDGSHEYTKKIITHYHQLANHQGVDTIINNLKKEYWIPRIRSVVKKTIRECPYCRRQTAKQVQPKMGLLPKERFFKYKKPFSATGMDYFGPFTVKIGRRTEKRYGVLFTCLTVRAIHVEIAHSLTTDSCIMALRRFLSRRGEVKVIWSDNGTNLRGANRELLEALDELQIDPFADELTNHGITWKFNCPLSPFMGGSWERLIGCFKRALMAVLRDQHPTDEVLQTLFNEAEFIVNSRPLTPVSDDPNDPTSITPNDILIGKSANIVKPGLFSADDLLLRKQWRISQYFADLFWKRWLREYLPNLIGRSKWTKDDSNLKEGEVVVINEPNIPRGVWPLGIIDKIYRGPDDVVRIVDVRTSQGIYKRPARRIHRLNIRIDDQAINTEGENVDEI